MSLNRIQKQFIRLAKRQRVKWISMSSGYPSRRRKKKWNITPTSVKIIDAVTGQSTIAKSYDGNPTSLKRWLKMRNVRAQFAEMVIKKNSSFNKLAATSLKDYPVIVQFGRTKYPYVLDTMGDKFTVNKRTTATIFLRTVDNIDYLSIINDKKKLLGSLVTPPVAKVKVKKVKRKRR